MNNSDIEGKYYCDDCKSIIDVDEDNHRRRYVGRKHHYDVNRYEWTGPDGHLHHVYAIQQIRCPHCGNWGAVKTRRRTKMRKCISCARHFQFNEGAFVDGIFLDKNPLLKQRAEKYIHEGCKGIEYGEEIEKKAVKLYKQLIEKSPIWEGYNPRTTAAGIIYIASIFAQFDARRVCIMRELAWRRVRLTQIEVADLLNVSEATVAKKYKAIAEVLEEAIANVLALNELGLSEEEFEKIKE